VTPPNITRLSLNQRTVPRWGVRQAIEGCLRHGIDSIGLWREPVADLGLTVAAALIKDAGLRVSSLCRGGFFNQPGWLDDNRAAVDEAATLSAACLVLVVGGLPDGDTDLIASRAHMSNAIAALAPYAAAAGVRLALEPMHPMYCADRGVLCTLGQALDAAAPHPPDSVAVMIDTFHLWWDPDAVAQIARAGRERRIAGFQVGDFLRTLPADLLLGRAMMGDGVIDFGPLCGAVTAAGYTGDVEVEIFNADIWAADPNEVLTVMKARYASLIARALQPAAD
jgi:sugar phosphate isomerase/epimerase